MDSGEAQRYAREHARRLLVSAGLAAADEETPPAWDVRIPLAADEEACLRLLEFVREARRSGAKSDG